MHDHSGEELEGVEGLGHSQPTVLLPAIENLAGALVERHALEADRGMQEVSGKALDLGVILRLNRDTVMDRETTEAPRMQHLDPLVREQALCLQKTDDLAPEEELRGGETDLFKAGGELGAHRYLRGLQG